MTNFEITSFNNCGTTCINSGGSPICNQDKTCSSCTNNADCVDPLYPNCNTNNGDCV